MSAARRDAALNYSTVCSGNVGEYFLLGGFLIAQPPAELTTGISDTERSSVAEWWGRLLPHQRKAVQLVLADPECTLQVSDRRVSEPSAAAQFFDDDWETNWADNWEADWREYLTEHPDVRLVTFEFNSYVVRHG